MKSKHRKIGFHSDDQDSDPQSPSLEGRDLGRGKEENGERSDLFENLSAIEIIRLCGENRMNIDQIDKILRPRIAESDRKALIYDLTNEPTSEAFKAYEEGNAEAEYLINESMKSNAIHGEGRDASEALKALNRQSVGDKVTTALKDLFGLDA
jgi:hypothetical protein